MRKPIFAIIILSLLSIPYFFISNKTDSVTSTKSELNDFPSTKKLRIESNSKKPDGFINYFNEISTRPSVGKSEYTNNYRFVEHKKSLTNLKLNKRSKRSFNVTEVLSRGPGNVGGRTRAIVVDPDDNTHNTWFAGSASGGIWKTTDAGDTWTNLTSDLPNLSTNSLAMSASNTDIMYAGTGEVFASNQSFVRGNGIFKSIDRGVTWNQLTSTIDSELFNSVNRIVIDPTNPDVVVVCTNEGIFKTINGGTDWVQNFDSSGNSVQDLVVDPTDFSIQYAGVNGVGIYKSTDGGDTWSNSSNGLAGGVRFELAVSPSNPNKVYTSTYIGEQTIIYQSDDKGASWSKSVQGSSSSTDGNFLGEQGWYDNSIAVHPYDEDVVFVGGVYIGKYEFSNTFSTVKDFVGAEEDNTTGFLDFVNFGQSYFNGQLAVQDGDNPATDIYSVEVRFGPSMTQKAHRFSVPSDGGTNGDGGAGVPDTDYTFEDYVDVPFEVWDTDNNRQLMVSFRDQEDDGGFNLNVRDEANDPGLLTAREYIFIHDIDYAETEDSNISQSNGNHLFNNLYFFWPLLADGGTFPPAVDGTLRFNVQLTSTVEISNASIVSDPRGTYGSKNDNLHADHHNLTLIPINESTGEFRIVNGNDGGLGLSLDGGETFEQILDGYITTQFYGADKKPGADEYLGGMQDNGTWISPDGENASTSTQYTEKIGGDGFEVIWHAQDPDKIMGSLYNNRFFRSTSGSNGNFNPAQSGINTEEGPFISRLATSRSNPETVFAVTVGGVLKTTNFGSSWSTTEISEGWNMSANGQVHDVEVSLSNDKIVWAGGGMSDGSRKMFVSTDGGDTFNAVTDYPDADLGSISGIATHPSEDSTAFVLFSFAGSPKILKTTDLGKTWTDISGFNTNNSTSSNGFPDVFVHSLLVLPNDINTIWAGTEIGLFESTDGGQNWVKADIGLPSVSIWTMKVVDDEVVLGTHGRGIWSITIPELNNTQSLILSSSYDGNRKATFNVDLTNNFDQVDLYVNNEKVSSVSTLSAGTQDITFDIDATQDNIVDAYLVTNSGGLEYKTPSVELELNFIPTITSFSQGLEPDILTIALTSIEEYDSMQIIINNELYETIKNVTLGGLETSVQISDVGTYTAKLIGYYGELGFESLEKSVTVNSITGLFATESKQFKLFPNPSKDFVNIVIPESVTGDYNLQVIDRNGRVVLNRNMNLFLSNTSINVNSLDKGYYMIVINSSSDKYVSKFIKY